MKNFLRLLLPALVLASCSEAEVSLPEAVPAPSREKVEIVSHEMIRLGSRLENPYSVTNIGKALAAAYPVRSAVEVPVNARYVRFLPKTAEDYYALEGLGVEMFDHPLDYEILVDGDYYQDPSIPEGELTWQYAVVPPGFKCPEGIRYEVIEDCFIPEDGVETRGFEDVDWDRVERLSFEATGNAGLLAPETRAKAKPSGKIVIRDEKLGKDVGVAGVKMMANVLVKVSSTFTDADGNYSFPAKFSARPRYSICFQNTIGFTIGMNLILVPASVSALGKDNPEGIDVKIDKNSDKTLFRRCAVNNAAYDYFQRCSGDGVAKPAVNLRFWILNILRPSSALMMHHGSMLEGNLVSNYLDIYKGLIRVFAPDITIGSKDKNGCYEELYSCASHEIAHASHFQMVGTSYWNVFTKYILSSFLMTGSCYGSGNGDYAGHCEVAEMWAYHYENMIYKGRYGTNPHHGISNWFRPDIFAVLEDQGVSRKDIFNAVASGVTDITQLQEELISLCPSKKTVITNAFKKNKRS